MRDFSKCFLASVKVVEPRRKGKPFTYQVVDFCDWPHSVRPKAIKVEASALNTLHVIVSKAPKKGSILNPTRELKRFLGEPTDKRAAKARELTCDEVVQAADASAIPEGVQFGLLFTFAKLVREIE